MLSKTNIKLTDGLYPAPGSRPGKDPGEKTAQKRFAEELRKPAWDRALGMKIHQYRWGRKQIEQMLADFQSTFEEFHAPNDTPKEVKNYGFYYMGCIICTGGSVKKSSMASSASPH